MAITADQARIELAKRELARRQGLAPIASDVPSQMKSNIAAAARSVLEMGGMVAGGIAGAPMGPIGAAGGGALGYAGGKSAADLLSRTLGVQQPIQNLPQAATETLQNISQGAQAEAGNSVLNPLIKGMGKAALKGASAYFGPTEEAIQARLANPNIKSENFSYPKTAQDLADHLNALQKNLSDIEDKTWGSLLKLKAEPKSSLLGMINNIKGQIKITNTGQVGSDADQKAIDALDRLATRIKNMGGTSSLVAPAYSKEQAQFFDQKQLREIIQSVSKDVNWEDPTASSKNTALMNFRHYLSEYLKQENPQYKDLIQQSADRTQLLHEAQQKFSLGKSQGQFVPTDATGNKVKTILNANKIQSKEVADNIKRLTGLDIENASQMTNYADQFTKTATQGSRRAVLGKAIGAALGGIFGHSLGGAAFGAMAGGYADKYAAQNLGATLDMLNKLGLNQALPAGPLGISAGISSLRNQQ